MKNRIIALISIFTLTLGWTTPTFALPLRYPADIGGAAAKYANKLSNSGFETVGTTSTQAANWQPFQGGYTRVSTRRSGSWGIKLTNTATSQQAGAYQRYDLNQTTMKPVFIGGNVKGTNIVKAPGTYFGAGIYVEIWLADGTVRYWNSIANDGTFDWRWVGFNSASIADGTGLPIINQPIHHIFVVPILGNASGTAYFDDLQLSQITESQPAVTVMFDDGELTTYTEGKAVLDSHNFHGTAAIPSGTIGDAGNMTATQLLGLQNSSWEIVSHGVNHTDLTTLTASQVTAELSQSKTALTGLGLTVINFALPFGAYNGFILGEAQKYYRSVRAFELGANPAGTFPFDVKVRGVVSTTTATELQQWLTEAASKGQWLVLVYHSIADKGDDIYHTPRATLVTHMNMVASSGIAVLTYNQGLNLSGI